MLLDLWRTSSSVNHPFGETSLITLARLIRNRPCSQKIGVSRVITPSFSVAEEAIILNTEPGSYACHTPKFRFAASLASP